MPSSNDPTPDPDTVKILIAEDHLDSQDALRILLEAAQYQVVVASDGQAAVDTALAELPDLILMDIMMPELDGLEATRLLRENDKTMLIPIIAITAMEGGKRLALEAGADDYLPKPIVTGNLLLKIDELLHQRRAPEL